MAESSFSLSPTLPLSTSDYTPLLQRVSEHARKTPDKVAATFLVPATSSGGGGGVVTTTKVQRQLTYRDLERVTSALAERLVSKEGLRAGDCAVLVYPPSLDFMVAFLACLKAHVVAVPVFPPHPSRRDSLGMFRVICDACRARFALTSTEYSHGKKMAAIKDVLRLSSRTSRASSSPPSWPELTWIVTDNHTTTAEAAAAAPPLPPPAASKEDDVAFLQFTSGSTSEPKGVMITNGNLAHNLTIITSELKAGDDTVVVSWLPQYHDMGLIGSYLGVLYCGGSGYYLSPLSFLQRPMIWLEAASQYRATHLQAPNFAFKLSARKLVTSDYDPPNGSKLDLSSVRHIINAAEPVDAGTIDAFQEAFAQFQLPRDVVFPTYGLAEHTVFVCSNGRARLLVDKEQLESHGRVVMVEDHNSGSGSTSTAAVTRLVGCGKPPASVTVRIVDPESHKLCNSADSTVGEIWIDSPSKAAGYYLKGEETRHDFHASLVVDGSDDGASAAHPPNNGFLRTGDLGFFYVGELFICGRIKDLIIVGGRNYYPQDLEATAEASEPNAVRPGCSAAFSIDPVSGGEGSGGEQVALVMELREVPKGSHQVEAVCSALADRIRGAINHEHALGVSVICFLQTRTVPKTSSGKIARSWCRKGYLNGTLQIVYRRSYAPATDPAPLEIEEANSGGVPLKSHAANGAIKPEEVARLRNMSRDEILAKLKTDVSRVASMPVDSVDKDAALVSMMDSLTLSQLKGLLERNYAVKLSDEYLFRESTTLQKLVDVVKLGYAPDDSDGGTNGEAAHAAHPHVPAPTPGRATGLAGALGCPPGVVCAIL